MPRILWKVSRLDITWPSVRVRAMTPALLLRRQGYDVQVGDGGWNETEIRAADIVIITKSFTVDDLEFARSVKELGKLLVVDLCDDVFMDGREASAASFREQAGLADRIVTTGEILRAAIERQVSDPSKLRIVPDHAETRTLTQELLEAFPPQNAQQRERVFGSFGPRRLLNTLTRRERALSPARRTIVWFGTAGLPGQGTGIEALAGIAPQLNAVARDMPVQLLIVSTAHGRVTSLATAFEFPCVFRDWRLLSVFDHVTAADVCVIPNPATDYARAKSPNRALLALMAGTPVVASASSAYAGIANSIIQDDFEGGVRRYLTDRCAAQADIRTGQTDIALAFSADAVAVQWAHMFSELMSGHA
jgi:hypothetical protein